MLRSIDSCLALQIGHFTKEFPGYEIESKWTLLNQVSVLTILKWSEDISFGIWEPYKIQKSMGQLPTGIRYFSIEFVFWGVYIDGVWREIAKAAKSPWRQNHYLLAFKEDEESFLSNFPITTHRPLKRKELRKGDWIDYQTMTSRVTSVARNATIIGKMVRERCSVYITNSVSFRNFCLSADRCESQDSILSQVEIEYKGRNGIWFWHPDLSGIEILNEFQILHSILENQYPGLLLPTTIKKFQWIINSLPRINKNN